MTNPIESAHAEHASGTPAGGSAQAVLEPESAELRELITPRADILETDEAVLVVADMPGVDRENVEITLEKDLLTIRGRSSWEAPPEFRLAYEEFALGDYERSFRITDAIDRDRIKASMKDGVLRITLPKAAPALPKKIPINPV